MVGSLKDDITRGGGGLTEQSRGVGEDGFLIGLLKRSGRKISLLRFFFASHAVESLLLKNCMIAQLRAAVSPRQQIGNESIIRVIFSISFWQIWNGET